MSKYVIGVDFGTLSARAVLYDVSDGSQLSCDVYNYPHGVLCETLPNGSTRLPSNYALQVPHDYIESLGKVCRNVIAQSQVDPADIIGIGIDFTSCTILPVDSRGTPLCEFDKFKDVPHSYVKLWKHHSAQQFACKTNYIINKFGYKFIDKYGGKVSSEWAVPKIWEVLDEAPDVYNAADYFIEAGDWLVWRMCGNQVRNSCAAGYKALWDKNDGYPDEEFFEKLDPRLKNLVNEKLNAPVVPLASRAGTINEEFSLLTGLNVGTPVAAACVDGHAMVAGSGISKPNKMLFIMGTSSNQMIVSEKMNVVRGICGVVADGMIPDYFGYEAGQAAFGDHFAWFVDNALPFSYKQKADELGIDVYKYLSSLAEKLKVGESGLVALDWWNGNRNILVDSDLSGLIVGMTLRTRPEEIFRALIEATAFGSRVIIENYNKYGISANSIVAAGGIAEKNPFLMQIFADVLDKEIEVSSSPWSAALGSAIFASVAAGKEFGGWSSVEDAVGHMTHHGNTVYYPNPENVKIYDRLFAIYKQLHDEFGCENGSSYNIMKDLIKIRDAAII